MSEMLRLARERAQLNKTGTNKWILEYINLLELELRAVEQKCEDRLSAEGWRETARQQERSGGTM